MKRAAFASRQDLNRGLNTLATIAAVVPLIGVLGTVYAILFDSSPGIGGNAESLRWIVAALLPTPVNRARWDF